MFYLYTFCLHRFFWSFTSMARNEEKQFNAFLWKFRFNSLKFVYLPVPLLAVPRGKYFNLRPQRKKGEWILNERSSSAQRKKWPILSSRARKVVCTVKSFLILSFMQLRRKLTHSSASSGTLLSRRSPRKRPLKCSWCCWIASQGDEVGGAAARIRLVSDANRCLPTANIADSL